MQPFKLRLVGLDPSLRNWGIAVASLTENGLVIEHLQTVNPVLPTGKQVRQNSLDMESAEQLYQATALAVKHAHAVFVEVPVGSQSARAMASYGICVGVVGALRANDTPFFEVTATEVKMAGFGKPTATKTQMIDWAVSKHPNANWPWYTRNGAQLISADKAEHMADAVGAIYAGLNLSSFKQLLNIASLNFKLPELV